MRTTQLQRAIAKIDEDIRILTLARAKLMEQDEKRGPKAVRRKRATQAPLLDDADKASA